MKSLFSILLSGLFAASFAQCSEIKDPIENTGSENNTTELSQTEITSLQWMREEEMLAHDVYSVLSEHYTLPVFRNISKSEMRHTTAVEELLDKYGIEDPAADHTRGSFQNPEIQLLYNQLVERGRESFDEAIRVGLDIEDMDIADLEKALDREVNNEDVVFVYTNLLRGSGNHLNAFWFHAGRNSVEWEPTHISKEKFDEIINSD
jgi:hypothetical protein